jgi:hypothetical protein
MSSAACVAPPPSLRLVRSASLLAAAAASAHVVLLGSSLEAALDQLVTRLKRRYELRCCARVVSRECEAVNARISMDCHASIQALNWGFQSMVFSGIVFYL